MRDQLEMKSRKVVLGCHPRTWEAGAGDHGFEIAGGTLHDCLKTTLGTRQQEQTSNPKQKKPNQAGERKRNPGKRGGGGKWEARGYVSLGQDPALLKDQQE